MRRTRESEQHKGLLMVSVVALVATACSGADMGADDGSSPEVGSVSQGIWNGTPISWPHSLHIQSSLMWCTAVMVNQRVALTAAHCVSNSATQAFYVERSMTGGVPTNGQTFTNVSVSRDSFSGSGDAADDCAVLRFATDLSGIPAPIYTGSLGHEKLAVFGWGQDTHDDESGILQYGWTVVDRRMTSYIVSHADEGQIRTCHGDSGAPWMKSTDAGWAVVAVHSNSEKSRGEECAEPHGRQEAFRIRGANAEWVKTEVEKAHVSCNWSGDIMDCR